MKRNEIFLEESSEIISSNLPDWELIFPTRNNPSYNEELFEREYEQYIKNNEISQEISHFFLNK